jgi:hypothetical protein
MRRGLMAWNEAELPKVALEQRLTHVRALMQNSGLDALVIYTNIARGAAVCWLTGFTPYWNEGLLLVPARGEMVFATALSKRVADWIESVMPAGQVITTPKPSALIGAEIAKQGGTMIGVLELDDFPAGHAQAILHSVSGAKLIDASALFADARQQMDQAERGLLATADHLAIRSCAAVDVESHDAKAFVAPCETVARLGGAEECFAQVVEDLQKSTAAMRADAMGALGETFAARISLAYKGVWTRHVVSFARDGAWQRAFDEAQARFLHFAFDARQPFAAQIKDHFAGLGELVDFTVEQARGTYPLAPVANHSGTADGFSPYNPFVLHVELRLREYRWIAARMIGL